MNYRHAALVVLLLLLASCAFQAPSYRAGVPCEARDFVVVDDFAGARRGRCEVLSGKHVRLTILPEDDGTINDSAWYSFKVIPARATTARITLRYRGGHHRYIPKLSSDGLIWTSANKRTVSVSSNATQATISTPVADQPLWISGQELITPAMYEVWSATTADRSDATLSVLGASKSGLPIQLLSTDSGSDDVLFLTGRQHPPEVSGAFAFFAFYEALLADTEVAVRFRERFDIIAIPMINPDGIVAGNWRHNLGGTDLNRDWGPFEQPETSLVSKLLDRLDADGKRIRVFLDFHSTKRNVFYTQDEQNVTSPPGFTKTWLNNAGKRVRDYPFTNEENPTDKIGVSKNYMYHRYGIPASTYEVGDETDRRAAAAAAHIFAEELMLLMLAQEY